jgi:hypothetical protein
MPAAYPALKVSRRGRGATFLRGRTLGIVRARGASVQEPKTSEDEGRAAKAPAPAGKKSRSNSNTVVITALIGIVPLCLASILSYEQGTRTAESSQAAAAAAAAAGASSAASIANPPWVGPEDGALVREARAAEKPFVSLSTTMDVRVTEDVAKRQRTVDVTTTYVLLPFRDIANTEEVFKEDYEGNCGVRIDAWYGTEEERPAVEPGRYSVYFAARTGEVHTLQTGARFVYRLPMCKDRFLFGETVPDGVDFFSHSADPLDELQFMMVVEANVPLEPWTNAARLRRAAHVTSTAGTWQATATPRGAGVVTLSARWRDLRQADEVALLYRVNAGAL